MKLMKKTAVNNVHTQYHQKSSSYLGEVERF